jgi:hypothetical protein
MSTNTIINIIGVVGIGGSLALLVREIVGFVREFEVRLFREDGKWWVEML